ncbi:MAG: thiamine pyrophosphate-binding protein, partial [Nitrospinota bacterium]
RSARLPVLYAGAGVVAAGAERELQRLAVKLGAPIFTSIQGRGVISEQHPLCGGPATFEGAEATLSEADVALALGTCFSQYTTLGWSLRLPEKLIQVDLDPSRIGRSYPVKVALVGDIKFVLESLLRRLEEEEGEEGEPSGEGAFRVRVHRHYYRERLRAFLAREQRAPFHGLWVVKTIRDVAPPETIFVTDSSATQAWLLEEAIPVYRPRSFLLSEAYQSMGYALPAAIGARLAEPERPVLCVVGDGNMAMACAELASAREAGVDLTVVVLNDGWYNALRISQQHRYGGRYVGTKLQNPDFAALARSFGSRGVRVEDAEALAPALERSFREGGVHLVEVPLDPEVLPSRWERAVRRWGQGTSS